MSEAVWGGCALTRQFVAAAPTFPRGQTQKGKGLASFPYAYISPTATVLPLLAVPYALGAL